ncbi:methenyltetrahydromethanopterin cyclohydrolase [Candidatus Bathyarchaeota archaeon]|nr:methenyltetrahydromethanopterin cyclohydrolase [Candidatus Bathyarchaeota archaeon]
MLSVNRSAYLLVRDLIEKAEAYRVEVKKVSGATIIDAGVEARGGYLAGEKVTEICLGGYGKASVLFKRYGDLTLPTVFVYTDHPTIATLGSQFAGWKIKHEKYFAMASGPARALALKPKKLYEKIDYRDESEVAVLVLETDKIPPEEVIENVAGECKVEPEKLYLIVAKTSSLVGSTQISGRVIETGIHRLSEVGLDPKTVVYACGSAPIAPVHPKSVDSMGMTNDAILYGGVVYLTLEYDDDRELEEIVKSAPSSSSSMYGEPFLKVFKEAGYDFYKIDPKLFAPSTLIVNNLKSGKVLTAGGINERVLAKSFGFR